MTVLNAAVAQQLNEFKAALDREMASGKPLEVAAMDVLKPIIRSIIDVVCFDGNGYSESWKEEAARRGLDTETRVPEMFKAFTRPESVELFTSLGIYSMKELQARNEVKWEMYSKKIQIEARVMGRMAINHIIPAALAYQTKLLNNVKLMKDVCPDTYESEAAVALELVRGISSLVSRIRGQVEEMVEARKAANVLENEYEKASAYHAIAERLEAIRKPIDKLEEIVDNDVWPLPKYRELLFIN
jgi:glutamine synthetase